MKKIVCLLLGATFLLASQNDGAVIFKNNCQVCHIMKKGWQLSKAQKASMKAPPAFGITKHVRDAFGDKKDFVEFVSNYIAHPDKSKAKCEKKAIKRFGLMPPIGAGMTKQERENVASWMFDNL